MEEIQLQQGFSTSTVDGRGIERLRFLALQFEAMGETMDNGADVRSVPRLSVGPRDLIGSMSGEEHG